MSLLAGGIDIYQNGWTTSNTIDLGVAGTGLFGGLAAYGLFGSAALAAAPYVLTAVTIYGVADFGITITTGNSISGWIGVWTE